MVTTVNMVNMVKFTVFIPVLFQASVQANFLGTDDLVKVVGLEENDALVREDLSEEALDRDDHSGIEKNTLLKFALVGKTKESRSKKCGDTCRNTKDCAYWNYYKSTGVCKSHGIIAKKDKTSVSGRKNYKETGVKYDRFLKQVHELLTGVKTAKECAKRCDKSKTCLSWVFWPAKRSCRLSGVKSEKKKGIASGKVRCQGDCTEESKVNLPTIPTECYLYRVLNDSSRLYSPSSYTTTRFVFDQLNPAFFTSSPDWKGDGYYRFMGPAGTKLANIDDTTTNSCTRFGSVGGNPSYLPTTVGENMPFPQKYLYGQYFSLTKTVPIPTSYAEVEVTNCGGFYVYYLISKSYIRFCGSY